MTWGSAPLSVGGASLVLPGSPVAELVLWGGESLSERERRERGEGDRERERERGVRERERERGEGEG